MAFSTGTAPPPPIWRRRRGEPIFTLPTSVEQFDGQNWTASPEALNRITGAWDGGTATDASFLSGRWRAAFPVPAGSLLVLYGRARGDLRNLSVQGPGGQPVPVAAYWLGLDAWNAGQQPRGWHPWAARVPNIRTVELHSSGTLRVSLLLARIQPDFPTGAP